MLTLKFIPYSEIESLNSTDKINRLLEVVKRNEIVLMEGNLEPKEETNLIEQTMKQINSKFKGVEICTIYPKKRNIPTLEKFKKSLGQFLLGTKGGLTIIGPATVIKEIRKDPDKIKLFTHPNKKRK